MKQTKVKNHNIDCPFPLSNPWMGWMQEGKINAISILMKTLLAAQPAECRLMQMNTNHAQNRLLFDASYIIHPANLLDLIIINQFVWFF